jgi:hypothetical protein
VTRCEDSWTPRIAVSASLASMSLISMVSAPTVGDRAMLALFAWTLAALMALASWGHGRYEASR